MVYYGSFALLQIVSGSLRVCRLLQRGEETGDKVSYHCNIVTENDEEYTRSCFAGQRRN